LSSERAATEAGSRCSPGDCLYAALRMHTWAEVGDTVPAVGTPWSLAGVFRTMKTCHRSESVAFQCCPCTCSFSGFDLPPPPKLSVCGCVTALCTAHPFSCVGNFTTTLGTSTSLLCWPPPLRCTLATCIHPYRVTPLERNFACHGLVEAGMRGFTYHPTSPTLGTVE
jgi:hypothetical protein